MLTKKQAIDKFKKFISSISEDDVLAVMPDTDVDGFASGVLVYKGVEKVVGKTPDILQFQHAKGCFTEDSIEYFKEKNVTKIIVTDQSYDQVPEQVKEVEQFADILIVDHHSFYNDVNSEKTTLIKSPMLKPGEKGSQYCASKMIYDLFSEMTDMADFDWICALGIISDSNYPTFKTFVDNVLKKYHIKKHTNIFNTQLAMAGHILWSVDAIRPPRFQQAFETLYGADDIYDIIDSHLNETSKKVRAEINFYVKNYKKFSEEYDDLDLLLLEAKTRYKINSPIINILSSEKFPGKTIIIYSEANKWGDIKISARNQMADKGGKIKVNAMLEYAVEPLEGASAGGHDPAAGASIKSKDWSVFKKRVMEYIKKHK